MRSNAFLLSGDRQVSGQGTPCAILICRLRQCNDRLTGKPAMFPPREAWPGRREGRALPFGR